ncbi:hypothetical protein [Alkalihalobacterium bogoriense]|uniref:hypothetical protein n=1 Tax=Alkalihalobacterium bogoriense TaxID=246272 RepID=UPI00047978DD|nr:hypothetical protein [Alkalihalobacterium bogoriense]
MKSYYWIVSGIVNYLLGIVFVIPGGFLYISILYLLEETVGWVIDPTLEPDFLLGALFFATITGLFYFPIVILVNVFMYKRLFAKKYLYYLFVILFWVLGVLSFLYYKLYLF